MEEISSQLLYQRLRNRVIELFETNSSFEDIAEAGAFETINSVFDWLPIDYGEAPNVFSEHEKEVIAQFIRLVGAASDATDEDTCDVAWFESSSEWARLSVFARTALPVFLKRGRFSEKEEDAHLGSQS